MPLGLRLRRPSLSLSFLFLMVIPSFAEADACVGEATDFTGEEVGVTPDFNGGKAGVTGDTICIGFRNIAVPEGCTELCALLGKLQANGHGSGTAVSGLVIEPPMRMMSTVA